MPNEDNEAKIMKKQAYARLTGRVNSEFDLEALDVPITRFPTFLGRCKYTLFNWRYIYIISNIIYDFYCQIYPVMSNRMRVG